MAGPVVGSMETSVRYERALRSVGAQAAAVPGPPEHVQAYGQMLRVAEYDEWREGVLERSPTSLVPSLPPDCFGLVLWMMRPTMLRMAIGNRRMRGLLSPPYVGVFDESVRSDIGFAHTIASWLNTESTRGRGPLALVPPVLEERDSSGQRHCFVLMLGAELYVK